ncbi:DUF2799 domain-containing protein [Arsukibacterium sp.]|uniref:DUF2799 domain-containing protein n=1 Tax=Arsukibacterium sp. TaxID=1977258 RepID=UPI002FDB26AB
MKKLVLLALPGLLLLSSCATMDKSACLTADWRTIGFEDGSRGKHEASISEYRKNCAKHGVTPDLTAYRAGHQEGSERFCTASNGFRLGQGGSAYQNSCPQALEPAFLAAHADGMQLHRSNRELQQRQAEVQKAERQIQSLELELAQQDEMLIADGYSREERIKIREQINLLHIAITEAYARLPELQRLAEQAHADHQRNVQRLSARY